MSDKTRIIQFGLGPIGSAVARHIAERPELALVGGVDIDPAKVGQDMGDVIGLDDKLGVKVSQTLADALTHTGADVAIHTTNSYFDQFQSQIIQILEAGLDIVSTAEELSFPWLSHANEATEIYTVAKRVGKTVLGTGVNPGFLMDSLPLNLTSICQQVDSIEVTRIINASERRGAFQKKIGSGMTVKEFRSKMDEGRMGHVGLPESMQMVFDTLGREMTHYEEEVEPVVAEVFTKTDFFEVSLGQAKGLHQVARGYSGDEVFVTLTFIAALAMDEDGDTVKINGRPNLEVNLKGTNGDIATVAMAVNAIKRVKSAAPGLVTMRDLPIVTR